MIWNGEGWSFLKCLDTHHGVQIKNEWNGEGWSFFKCLYTNHGVHIKKEFTHILDEEKSTENNKYKPNESK
jgi:hypothetical protein